MSISGLNENNLSEESKKALQSETWQKAREAMIAKREIKHFTSGNGVDNAYGATWAEAVNTYLKTEYKDATGQSEVEAFGTKYKVLKRDKVTTFYDADGNTLFDVENERLASEYDWWMNAPEKKEETVQEETAPTEEIPVVHQDNIEPAKDRAKKKLEDELKKAKDKSFAEPIIGYLLKRCEEDSGLAEDVVQEHKTWDKCFDYIYFKARKQAEGNRAVVRDDVVYEWAEDYYHKDDKAEEEMKAKKASETKKKAEERAAKAKEKAGNGTNKISKNSTKSKEKHIPTAEKKEAPAEKKEEPKPKKNSKDLDGQMDIFSMMGI